MTLIAEIKTQLEEAMREEAGVPMWLAYASLVARWVEQARSQLAPDVFDSAWASGRAMNAEEAVQFALRADAVAP